MRRPLVLLLVTLGLLVPATASAQALDAIPLASAVVHQSPNPNRLVTAQITALRFNPAGVHVEFTKQDGPDRWPDVRPPGWTGDLQYTLWIGMFVGGQWHVLAAIEYWHSLDAGGGDVTLDNQIARNWTYDGGEMARQPAPGELVAFFVTAGDQRKKDVTANPERSNVVTVPFPSGSATYTWPLPGPVVVPPDPVPPPVVVVPPVVVPTAPPNPQDSAALARIDLQLAQLAAAEARLEAQLAAVNANVSDGRAENKGFFMAVASEWKRILAVASPIVAGVFAWQKTK